MRSPVLVGTRSLAGQDNLAVFNSMTHIGARPPLVALVFRPLTVERHTYDNLRASGLYTINHIQQRFLAAAHATSAKLARGVSEFAASGLTPVLSESGVPYVAEAQVSMQLRFVEEHFVAANDSVIVIGQVEELRLAEGIAFSADRLDWSKLDAAVVSGLYHYYRVVPTQQMEYVDAES